MADNIGDLSVDVTADTTALEARLKVKLEELSKKLQAKIALTVSTLAATKTVETFKTTVGRDGVKGTLTVWTKGADGEMSLWRKLQESKPVTIALDLSKKSLAGIGGKLMTLSGLNAISGEFTKFGGIVAGIFNAAPAVGQAVLAITAAGSLLETVLGSVLVTINLLASAGPGLVASLVAIPGIFAGVAIQAAVLVVALKNAPPAIKEAIKDYKVLKTDISNNFWAPAAAPIKAFLDGMLSQFREGFKGVATLSGQFFGSFAADLQKTLGNGALLKMFDNIKESMRAFAPAAAPLANILANLGLFGTSLLPGISKWLLEITNRFNAWLQVGLQTGSLYTDLAQLKFVLGIVWDGVQGLIGIFKGLGDAAANAGIGNILSPLQSISAIVNSPTFQTALTTFFAGSASAASSLLGVLGPIGNLLAAFAPMLASFAAVAGQELGALIGNLANALNNPVFRQGLGDFLGGALDFIKPLIPLMPIFAEKLALIGHFAGVLLSTLGPVFASLLQTLVPVFGSILTAVEPLTKALGPVLSKVFEALGPVIGAIVIALKPFIDLIIALLPPALQLIQVIAGALAPVLKGLAPVFMAIVQAILPIVNILLQALMPIIGPLVQLIVLLSTVALKPLGEVLKVVGDILMLLSPVLQVLGIIIGAVIQTLVDLLTGNTKDLAKVWTSAWDAIVGVYQNTIQPLFDGFVGWISGIWKDITGAFANGWKQIMDGLGAAGKWISDTWNSIWKGVSDVFMAVWNGISSFEKGIFNGIMRGIAGFVNGAIDIINGLTKGLAPITAVVGIKLGAIPHISLPQLAMGATILPRAGGTAVVVGEGGKAESVVDTGLLNKLLAQVTNSFPGAVGAVRSANLRTAGRASTSSSSSTTNNFENHFPVPPGTDPAALAQQYVNRMAEKVGL